MVSIEFQNMTLCFNDRKIIHNFSASLFTGEFIGIFGPNGAGKSTLLRTILGLVQPSKGQVLVFNKSVRRGNTAIGYMPQSRHLMTSNKLTARSYITATLQGFRLGLPLINLEQRAQVNKVIHLVDIEKFVDRPYRELSG
ncbi:MAG: ATP-binding cassette domain-containing protein, partial [Gammaproteobacteria bacterium]|nr:ATP-binding cassette domain-containing protein [Gammaproteobacteria bacterium]